MRRALLTPAPKVVMESAEKRRAVVGDAQESYCDTRVAG